MISQKALSLFALFVFILSFLLSVAFAQVANCNGVWTNKPCNEHVQKLPEQSGEVQSPAQLTSHKRKTLREKKSLLHKLTMKKLAAEQEYELKLDIADLEEFCGQESTNVSDCRKQVSDREERIDRRIFEAQTLEAQVQANKLQAERNKIEATKEPPKVVTIVQRPVFIHRRPRPTLQPQNPPEFPGSAGITTTIGSEIQTPSPTPVPLPTP